MFVQLCGLLAAVVHGAVRDRQQTNLLRRHPRRQRTGVGFKQIGQRPLIAAERRAVDDVRQLLFAVLINIVHAELLSQQHIDLDRDQRILLAVDVLILDIQLRAVECGLVDADRVIDVEIFQDTCHRALRMIPLLRGALILIVGVRGIPLGEAERALVEQADRVEAVFRQVEAALELLFELIRAQHQMALGDRELTHTDQSMHLAGILVAEQRATSRRRRIGRSR